MFCLTFCLFAFLQDFRTDAQLVVLHATVTDRQGHIIPDVPPPGFVVRDENVQQSLKFVRREDLPVSLALVIDNSGSMRGKRAEVEKAAMTLITGSNPEDEICVINFSGTAYLDQDFTSDSNKLRRGLRRIRSEGFTAMRDTVDAALWHVDQKATRDKRVIVVVTDGADTVSSVGMQDLLRRLRQSGTIVYAIGVLGDEDRGGRRAAKRALNAITKASGGQAFYAQDVSEVEGFAKRIAAEIRSQYVLGYTPVDLALDGKYRRVRVTLSDDQQAVVRTRDGYFAVPFGRKPRSMNASPVILLPGPGGGSR